MAYIECNVISSALERQITIGVVLPSVTKTELSSIEKHTHQVTNKYPVLYLLSGDFDNHRTWQAYTSIERYAEERSIAVVTISVERNMYLNMKEIDETFEYNEFYTFLNKEIPEFVSAFFPISVRKEDSYIAGVGVGGFGAMYHGFTNPNKYCAIGLFSPVTSISEYSSLLTLNDSKKEKYSISKILNLAKKKTIVFPKIYFSTGSKDYFINSQHSLKKDFDDLNIENTYEELADFGQEWGLWDKQVKKFLDWIPRTDAYANEEKRSI